MNDVLAVSAMNLYHILDYFFLFFHTLLILFNLFGWLHRKTQWLNFIALSVTGFSWFVLGIWKGFGYCPCTDWHWQVLAKIGANQLPDSYVQYLIERISGIEISAFAADLLTGVFFTLALLFSIRKNLARIRSKNKNSNGSDN